MIILFLCAMFMPMPRLLRWNMWLVLVFMIPYLAVAQEEYHYTGPLTIGTYQGTADFYYFQSAQDSLLDGSFRFKSLDAADLLTEKSDLLSVSGQFSEDVPVGLWKIQFGNFEPGGETSIVNNHYQIDLTGTQSFAEGRLSNGKPDGQWILKKERIESSSVAEVLFNSSIYFQGGIPQQNFRIENEQMTLVGRFLRDGLAHDQWELYGIERAGPIERWQFEEGRLKQLIIMNPERVSVYPIFPQKPEQSTIIRMDERFMELVRLNQMMARPADSLQTSEVYTMLRENADYYREMELIFSEISSTAFAADFRVQVPYFAINNDEQLQLDSAIALTEKSLQRIRMLENSQLQLMKLANKDVMFLASVMDSINHKYIVPLNKLTDYEQANILEFTDRRELTEFLGLAADSGKPLTISIAMDNEVQTFTGPTSTYQPEPVTSMTPALKIAHNSFLSLDSIGKILEQKLTQRQREQKLAILEEQLVVTVNELSIQADSLSAEAPNDIARAIRETEARAQQYLREYSNGDNSGNKTRQAQALITCFEQMSELSLLLSGQPAQWAEIQEAYTDQVWNPFTATVMEEEIKKHILTAYRSVLMPYILQSIESGLTCDNTQQWVILLEKVHLRMNEMVTEDTKRLERKLKRERDPEVVLELIGIQNSRQ